MNKKEVINLESDADIKKRKQIEKRKEEIIKLVMRQTNYTRKESEERLMEWNNNYINVIKEYINPKFNEKKPKIYKSTNQGVLTEIRGFMDKIDKSYRIRKERSEYYTKVLLAQQKMKAAANKDISNTKL